MVRRDDAGFTVSARIWPNVEISSSVRPSAKCAGTDDPAKFDMGSTPIVRISESTVPRFDSTARDHTISPTTTHSSARAPIAKPNRDHEAGAALFSTKAAGTGNASAVRPGASSASRSARSISPAVANRRAGSASSARSIACTSRSGRSGRRSRSHARVPSACAARRPSRSAAVYGYERVSR